MSTVVGTMNTFSPSDIPCLGQYGHTTSITTRIQNYHGLPASRNRILYTQSMNALLWWKLVGQHRPESEKRTETNPDVSFTCTAHCLILSHKEWQRKPHGRLCIDLITSWAARSKHGLRRLGEATLSVSGIRGV